MKKQSVFNMVLASMFAAIIAVFVAFLFHVPIKIGANTAYLHFGDAFIFLAASLLPTPYALASAGIGGFFGDVFCGAAQWAPFTLIIKMLVAFCFISKPKKILCVRNYIAPVFALIITVVGYYIAEALLYSNWVTPLLSIWGNVVQIAGSAIIYYALSAVLDRLNIKKRISLL